MLVGFVTIQRVTILNNILQNLTRHQDLNRGPFNYAFNYADLWSD